MTLSTFRKEKLEELANVRSLEIKGVGKLYTNMDMEEFISNLITETAKLTYEEIKDYREVGGTSRIKFQWVEDNFNHFLKE